MGEQHHHAHRPTRRRLLQAGAGGIAVGIALPGAAMAVVEAPARAMAGRAAAFLAALPSDLQLRAALPFEEANRFDWHYAPRRRKGVPLRDMDAAQRAAADALLRVSLSEVGYRKATDIMALEAVLRQIETFGLSRDPENYAFTLFGEPGRLPWGWRLEGHHLVLNFTIVTDDLVAVTPAFFGANPARIPSGPRAGHRTLAHEQDLGRQLVRSLDGAQRGRAVIADRALGDIVTGPGRADSLKAPQGLALADLGDGQRDLAWRLVREFVGKMADGVAEAQLRRIRDAGTGRIHFAWAGSLADTGAHYYRLHGPALLLEYDNSQNDANHIHTVLRDPANDFGRDFLEDHYAHGHAHKQPGVETR